MLDVDYINCSGQLPDAFIEKVRWCYDLKTSRPGGQYPVLLFFREGDPPGAEPHYYAHLDRDLNFDVHLPEGEYVARAVPSDYVLGCRAEAWRNILFVVDSNGLEIRLSRIMVRDSVEKLVKAGAKVRIAIWLRQFVRRAWGLFRG